MFFKSTTNKKGHSAFTITEDHLISEIITDCGVSMPWLPGMGKAPSVFQAKALWDTGATNSVITMQLAKKLGLVPIGKANVHHGAGSSASYVYKVNIILPNNVLAPFVDVTEFPATTGNFDIIIGMNIINRGDFAITNVNQKSMVSFRLPSVVSIDFNDDETVITPTDTPQGVPSIKTAAGAQVHIPSNTPRNNLCPCNSGKKYKHCHGRS